jgi:hypothetical protein
MSDTVLDTEYLVFRTQIQGTWKAFDPWRLDRLFAVALNGELLGSVIAASRGTKQPDGSFLVVDPEESFKATERLYNATRTAFALPPLDAQGAGVGEQTVRRILGEWLLWKAQLKKNSASSPTSPAPTGSTPPASTEAAT